MIKCQYFENIKMTLNFDVDAEEDEIWRRNRFLVLFQTSFSISISATPCINNNQSVMGNLLKWSSHNKELNSN